jgi:hypothetical protein
MSTNGTEAISISNISEGNRDSLRAGVADSTLLDENITCVISIGNKTTRLFV